MTLLPFKTSNPYTKVQGTAEISDGLGNCLEVPKYGCVTWQEHEHFAQYSLEASSQDDLSVDAYHTEVVCIFLRYRFNLPDTSREDLLQLPEGDPFPQPLIEALWTFFKNERERWGNLSKQESNSKK